MGNFFNPSDDGPQSAPQESKAKLFFDPADDASEDSGDVWRGAKTAAKQIPQLGYGLIAGAGAVAESAFGAGGAASAIKDFGVRKYQEADASIQKDAKETDSLTYSWDQAKQGNYGAMVDWLQYGIGYGGVQALEALASGGLGAILGKATLKQTVEHLASGMVSKEVAKIGATQEGKALAADAVQRLAVSNVAANIGAKVGIGAQAFGMEGGEIMGGLAEQSSNEGRTLTGAEIAKGLGATLAAGGLEFVGDKIGVDLMLGKSALFKPAAGMTGISGRAARAGVAAAGAIPIEAGTEYFQTGIEEYGQGKEANILPWNQSPEAQRQAFDAAGLGAVGGGAMAVGGGMLTSPSAQPEIPRATPADVAAAETPEAAAAAIADIGTGIAGSAPIAEALTETQAEIDALLSAPIESAGLPQMPAVVPLEAQPGVVAADLPIQPDSGLLATPQGIPNAQDQAQQVAPALQDLPQAAPEAGALPDQLAEAKAAATVEPTKQPIGAGVLAQRQQIAAQKFIESAGEQFGLSSEEAGKAWDHMVKAKLINVDSLGGQYTLKDGRFWDGDVLRRAAGIEQQANVDSVDTSPERVGNSAKTEQVAPERAITRINGGKLEITGFDRDEVADTLKTAKIAATVTAGKDGRILVSVVDRAGNPVKMPVKTQNAINKALMPPAATPKKARTFTGNLRNDVNLIAPGLYAEVARGGDGEGMAGVDMSLIAERLRDEGFMLPTTETGKDSDAVIEIIRQDIANGGGTLNEARMTAAMTEAEQKAHRADVLRLADEYGIPAKENGIWRKSEDVLDDVERAIKHEIGLAGRSVVEITKSGAAAGAFTNAEAKSLTLEVAEGYRDDQGRDAKVRMYREIANLLQDKINERESTESREVGRGSGEGRGTPSEAEAERPALELAGQSEAEARADEERIAAAEAQAREEETRAAAAERQARIDAEVASRQDVAADNFTLDAQVNDQAAQRAADKKRADDQLAGQGDIFGAPIDAAAHEAATSPKNDKPAPTPAQKEAGNYAMGHIRLHGFDISIENPKGSERVAKDGSWRVPSMPAHYGYIKGTVGADKEHLDVFVGPDPESTKVWIINQVAPNSSPARFDEHKVMIGFGSAEDAKDAYLGSFEGDFGAKVFGSMTQALTIEQLEAKIESGDLSRKKFVGPVAAEATGGRGLTPDTRPPPKPDATPKTPADAGVSVSAAVKQSTATPQLEITPQDEKSRLTIDSVPPARLKKITVSVDALVGDQQQKIEVPAKQAIADINEEIRAYELLLACVKG